MTSLSDRLAFASLSLFSVVLFATYSGDLTAFVTAGNARGYYRSFQVTYYFLRDAVSKQPPPKKKNNQEPKWILDLPPEIRQIPTEKIKTTVFGNLSQFFGSFDFNYIFPLCARTSWMLARRWWPPRAPLRTLFSTRVDQTVPPGWEWPRRCWKTSGISGENGFENRVLRKYLDEVVVE